MPIVMSSDRDLSVLYHYPCRGY